MGDVGRAPTEVEAGGDGGKHARHSYLLCRQICRKGREKGEADLDCRIGEVALEPGHYHGHQQPNDHTPQPDIKKLHGDFAGGNGHGGRSERGPEGHKGGRIVDKALALKEAHNLA